jgi:hypothetical protein
MKNLIAVAFKNSVHPSMLSYIGCIDASSIGWLLHQYNIEDPMHPRHGSTVGYIETI